MGQTILQQTEELESEIANTDNSVGTGNTTATDSPGLTGDSDVMSYFTLPAEYAFVGRALSQVDGVGKSLDPDFDFVSAAAPWIVEIKGGERYVRDEALKYLNKVADKIRWLNLPHYNIDPPRKKRTAV